MSKPLRIDARRITHYALRITRNALRTTQYAGARRDAYRGERRTPLRSTWFFWLGIVVYAVTYFTLYPKVPAIADENAYLTQASLFRAGRLSYDDSGIPAPEMSVDMAGRTVSKYPPGNSILLVPFALAGWRWTFCCGLLLAIAGTLLFRATLRLLEPAADPAWSLLYLLYPAVVLYSRTIMSDLPAATAVLAGFYCLLRAGRWSLLAGLCLGYACLVRYSTAVLAPVFVLLLVLRPGRKLRDTALLFLGLAPFALLAMAYNNYCYGGPFRFPWYLTGRFSFAFLPGNLAFYLPVLLVLYPLMLFAPLLAGRSRRLALSLPAYALLLPGLLFSYTPTFARGLAGAALGLRYLIPAVPFFVMGFVLLLHRLETGLVGLRPLKFATVGVMLVLSVAIQYRHDRYLSVQDSCRRLVLNSVPAGALLLCNPEVSELLNPAWGWREYRHIAEHNVPMPLDSAIVRKDTVYAALLVKPDKQTGPEIAAFSTLLARFPERSLVQAVERPNWIRVYRLKPGWVSPARRPPSARP